MIHFLNPAVLFGLVAGIIPLLIHLLNRKKFREIPFSTVHFLKQMSRKEMRRLKIRQILLLIIRTLIVLLLVLAFARPTLKSSGSLLAGRSAVEMVFLLDNSLSLNRLEIGGSLLEKVRETWLSLEPLAHSGDRISVVTLGNPPAVLVKQKPYSPGIWQKVASELHPGALRGDFYTALLKAVGWLKNSSIFRKEIFIISDFQKSNIQEKQIRELLQSLNFPVHFYLIPITAPPVEDVSVDSVEIVNRLIEKDQELQIEALVRNNHPQKYLTSLVSLILDNVRVARQNVSLAPGEGKLLNFRFALQQSGFVRGYVECESDMLAENNRYYFNFYVPDEIALLHIVPGESFHSYLPLILQPALEKKIFRYKRINSLNWSNVDFARFRVIVLEGFNHIPEGLALRLQQFVQTGGGLWIIPGNQIVPTEMNRFLEALKMGQILELAGHPGNTTEFLTQGKIRWGHPIFERLFEKKGELHPIEFYAYYRYKPTRGEEVLIPLKNGDPLLSTRFRENENVAFFTVPLQTQWTNLLYRGFVVPLSYRLLYYMVVRQHPAAISIHTGEKFTWRFEHLPAPYQFTVRDPSNLLRKVIPTFRGKAVQVEIQDNLQPGNYEILQGGHPIALYSVNPDPEESRQQFLEEKQLRNIFPWMHWFPPEGNISEAVEKTRFGKELWPYLLGLVLLLLLVEMILGYTGSRKEAERLQQELASE